MYNWEIGGLQLYLFSQVNWEIGKFRAALISVDSFLWVTFSILCSLHYFASQSYLKM
jgi:hypothetical protein